ncbi:MAG: hypothetical protein AAFX06_21735, partial [Planctomycetota bacterium]
GMFGSGDADAAKGGEATADKADSETIVADELALPEPVEESSEPVEEDDPVRDEIKALKERLKELESKLKSK